MPSDRLQNTTGPAEARREQAAVARMLLVLLACLIAVILSGPSQLPEAIDERPDRETVDIRIAGEEFSLWIAADDSSQHTGLAGLTDIPDRGGMLFVYPTPRPRRFYMAYCLIDIDLIFLDSESRIVALHEMSAEPPRRTDESEAAYSRRLPRYRSLQPAQYAIELKAGSIRRLGLRVGQRIDADISALIASPKPR